MLGWLLGLGLLGGGWLWYRSVQPTAEEDQALTRATQDLLAFFNRNRGIVLGSSNPDQNARVRAFQIAWSQNELPKLRTDGIWDSTTANVFRQLTGYSPPPVGIPLSQRQVTSGYLPPLG